MLYKGVLSEKVGSISQRPRCRRLGDKAAPIAALVQREVQQVLECESLSFRFGTRLHSAARTFMGHLRAASVAVERTRHRLRGTPSHGIMIIMQRSPKILSVSWGRLEIEGLGVGKDFKLYPGGGRAWDWRETGTEHDPGIQPADVEELLEQGALVVVLSRGMLLRLKTSPETIRFLEQRGVRVHLESTKKAVELYNRLAESEPVGGLFHTTC